MIKPHIWKEFGLWYGYCNGNRWGSTSWRIVVEHMLTLLTAKSK